MHGGSTRSTDPIGGAEIWNQIDRCYAWKSTPNGPARLSLDKQESGTTAEFEDRAMRIRTGASFMSVQFIYLCCCLVVLRWGWRLLCRLVLSLLFSSAHDAPFPIAFRLQRKEPDTRARSSSRPHVRSRCTSFGKWWCVPKRCLLLF